MTIKPEIHPKIIFRVPKFPMDARLEDCWEELKEAIALSSPEFYQYIATIKAEDLASLPAKIRHTVDKYFNRARYRPVPYGTFAGIGLVDPTEDEKQQHITIAAKPVLHTYVDWAAKDRFPYDFDDLLAADGFVFANSSYYPVKGSLRYLYRDGDKFELAETEQNKRMTDILVRCRKPVKIRALLGELEIGEEQQQARDLLEGMIVAQLLISSLDPNVIGDDYFQRRGIDTDGQPTYDLQEQLYLSGKLPPAALRSIPSVIEKLYRLMPSAGNPPDLDEFIRRFGQKFDRRLVPLMVALDPELGVGYGNFEQAGGTEPLVAHLAQARAAEKTVIASERLAEAIGPKVFTGAAGTISLDELLTAERPERLPLPNTFSALITCCDGLVSLEYAGGPSATMLAGRFTLASNGIARFSAEMAALEQTANPAVLFFDIAYMAEAKADNVNRRKRIYETQLSIVGYDTSEQPLTLDDIYICPQGSTLMLWSRSLRKRLIPRTASAYNHRRSDLPLFRLLSDLQYQGIHTNLTLDLQALCPGLAYYPRVQDRNVVVAAAKWRLDLNVIFPEGAERDAASVRRHLYARGAQGYLKYGPADQKLCFDLGSDSDLEMMLRHWENETSVYVEEAFIADKSVIRAEGGQPYYGQFMLTLTHSHQVFAGADIRLQEAVVTPHYAPGSQWLYWEIYCHSSRADQILLQEINTLLHENNERIKKWFFIRYDEGGPHIRLRVLRHEPADVGALIARLAELLAPRLCSGLVSDLQIKTYQRELERYGSASIELAETHFCMDSRYVLSLLPEQYADYEKYWLCIDLARAVRGAGVTTGKELLAGAKTMHGRLWTEHNAKTPETKLLNLRYLDFRKTAIPSLTARQMELRAEMVHTLTLLLLGKKGEDRIRLFCDLIHMHINRLFADHQRTHELIFYNFLIKEWQREAALSCGTVPVRPVPADDGR